MFVLLGQRNAASGGALGLVSTVPSKHINCEGSCLSPPDPVSCRWVNSMSFTGSSPVIVLVPSVFVLGASVGHMALLLFSKIYSVCPTVVWRGSQFPLVHCQSAAFAAFSVVRTTLG